MIPLEKTIITKEMINAAANALANEDLLFGEDVYKFEEEFASYCRTDYSVSVGSGTDALIFSLLAAGVKGKEVITSPSSYIASANTAYHAGGKPVFCDIGHNNNIDPAKIRTNRKTGAIIPVHLHGYPADMDEIMEIAGKKNIAVIEDACQAHGALYRGRRAGSIGHIGCFSFNPVKNMTVAGEGGMVVTNDGTLAKKVRMLADSGRESIYTHKHKIIGFSSRINTVNAAIGRVQLRHLERWNAQRRKAAKTYEKLLDGSILPPLETDEIKPVFNKFAVRLRNRNAMKRRLWDSGIECDAHYPIPIHLQPPYDYIKGSFPNAERFARTTLSIPMFPGISKSEMEEVCSLLE